MLPPNPFHWKGVHHGYLGAWFIAFGSFFLYMNLGNNLDFLNPLYQSFIGIGAYLIIDDTIEHVITKSTPLRILWEWLLRRNDH